MRRPIGFFKAGRRPAERGTSACVPAGAEAMYRGDAPNLRFT
jgi:hypothetical protein